MSQSLQNAVRLYHFLQDIYGDQSAITHIEVDIKQQSNEKEGPLHVEVTSVRVYADDAQILPDFTGVPYWQEMLSAYPHLFLDCQTQQDYLDTVQEFLEEEHLYREYGLIWPQGDETLLSPLRFNIQELRQISEQKAKTEENLLKASTEESKPPRIIPLQEEGGSC